MTITIHHTGKPSRATLRAADVAERDAAISEAHGAAPLLSVTLVDETTAELDAPVRQIELLRKQLNGRRIGAAPAAAAAAPAPKWRHRILVLMGESAPAQYRDAALDGYGKTFIYTLDAHERSGCGEPDLVGCRVRYAYYR